MKQLSLVAAIMLFAASCQTPGDDGPVAPAEPIELGTRGAEKVAADNAFAFRFFRETLATTPTADRENAFVSPLSLTVALGMLYNGTSPEAAAEMEQALGMAGFTPEEINAHYRTLIRALLEVDPRTALAIANSIWTREGYPVDPAFYDINRQYYDAEVQSRDFGLQATLDEINKWCADRTNHRIPEMLKEIPAEAVMYLINAVYFKGQWKFEFDKAATRDEDFHLADGSTKKVKMMTQKATLPYYEDRMLRCVDLPYGNGAFSMMVMMPTDENGSLDDLVASLDADVYDRAVERLHEKAVMLKLPRWTQECEFGLIPAVKNLGMELVFRYDLPVSPLVGISGVDPTLHVSMIKQKTFVEVSEQGTEAAAVTVVGIEYTSSTGQGGGSMPFIADRPFLYIIRERSTGAIIFMGRMDSPEFS